MITLGVVLVFGGYTVAFYGYVLIRGYDLSFKDLISPKNYYQGQWPPNKALDDVIIPTGGQGQSAGKKPVTTA